MPSDDVLIPEERAASQKKVNRYTRIITDIFDGKHAPGMVEVPFTREDIISTASKLGLKLPKNVGDLVYTFRYRANLPAGITDRAPPGKVWVIRPAGRGKYRFSAVKFATVQPTQAWKPIKVPDSTPGIIDMYAKEDEQALLAKIRYNRLIDIFTGITCYSLQSHLRTTVQDLGQIETDEIYVGVDAHGVHYILPVQAKRGSGVLGIIQIESDIQMCGEKFPDQVCKPIGAQFLEDHTIALFQFETGSDGVAIREERHYRLVPPSELTPEELTSYRTPAATGG